MIAKSGNHFCDKIMLKQLILREFLPTSWFHLGRNAQQGRCPFQTSVAISGSSGRS